MTAPSFHLLDMFTSRQPPINLAVIPEPVSTVMARAIRERLEILRGVIAAHKIPGPPRR